MMPKQTVHEIVNKVDKLLLEEGVREHFLEHIIRLCKMAEDYGGALQPYIKKLKTARNRIDGVKYAPGITISLIDECPPPKGWIKGDRDNNKFFETDEMWLRLLHYPIEPVNPLPWFGFFPYMIEPRKPTENEKFMCDYFLLAAIHDHECTMPTDISIFSKEYNGKWFKRDEFRETVFHHYWAFSKDSDERLSVLGRAFDRVEKDLKDLKDKGLLGGKAPEPTGMQSGKVASEQPARISGQTQEQRNEQTPPKHLITLKVAVAEFKVSRSTLMRAIRDKKLKSYRPPNASPTTAHLIDAVQVASRWQRRK